MRSFVKTIMMLALLAACSTFSSCFIFGLKGGYSFTGASIPANAKTFSVAYIPNNTADFPTLSNALTEGLRDRFTRQTRLSQVPENGDLAFEGEITIVKDEPSAIGAGAGVGGMDAGATSNRVTVTVQILFTNVLQPELSFENRQTFSAYVDYPTTAIRSTLESGMVDELVTALVDNIFNASVAQW